LQRLVLFYSGHSHTAFLESTSMCSTIRDCWKGPAGASMCWPSRIRGKALAFRGLRASAWWLNPPGFRPSSPRPDQTNAQLSLALIEGAAGLSGQGPAQGAGGRRFRGL